MNNLRTEFVQAMTRLRHYKVVDFQPSEIHGDDAVVTIYPTISLLVQSDSVENLVRQLNEYKATEAVDEGETDENSPED